MSDTSARGSSATPPVNLDSLDDEQLRYLIDAALDRLSVDDLGTVIQAATEKRRGKQNDAMNALMQEFRDRATSMGLRAQLSFLPAGQEGGTRRSRRNGTSTVAPKFRGPNNEEWSGRGRTPRWLQRLESEGHHREEYRIG
jgi:DNA-binding protein H-NS